MNDSRLAAYLKSMPSPFSRAEVNRSLEIDHDPSTPGDDPHLVTPAQWARLIRERVIQFIITKKGYRTKTAFYELTEAWK